MFYLTTDPIAPWAVVAVAFVAVLALTLWAYARRLRGAAGRWRWVALSLRLAAVVLCLMAALRPTVVILQRIQQTASLVLLVDDSTSMAITDERGGQSRWDAARTAVDRARESLQERPPGLEVRYFGFDDALRDYQPGDTAPPKGRETALGSALAEVLKREEGTRLAAVLLFSDGASNGGLPPLVAAERLRDQQVPVVSVGFGSAGAGASSRDLAVRELATRPTVFIKNDLQVRGTLKVRGYPDQPIDVELLVEGKPVARTQVKAPAGQEVLSVDLKYTPQTAGEQKITLRVEPKEGELVPSNNEYSTFVTVLSGGLNVLYLQGPHSPWEYKFLTRALDAAQEIQADVKILRQPGQLDNADLAPGRYDIYILGDVPADFLSMGQQNLLVAAVERGAGLMMLGGRSSFGAGGWAGTPVAGLLPTIIHPGDGQIEPEGGLRVVPNLDAPHNYILQIGPTKAESVRLWSELPAISGANRLGRPKRSAVVLAESGGPTADPLMVAQEVPQGRVLTFAGETWVWARASVESQRAHRKFWRQAILWLAHKEDQDGAQVKLALDRRRVAVGEKIELTASAFGPDGTPLPDAHYEATLTGPEGQSETVPLYNQGSEARGTYFASGSPGDYRVTVTATHAGQDLGRASARFLSYQTDRELENPAADLALLKQISELTEGSFLPPEGLGKFLKALDSASLTEDARPVEYRVWDNWPFFLIFTFLLTAEWWLRKRKGWV